jgi:hypothetical protein
MDHTFLKNFAKKPEVIVDPLSVPTYNHYEFEAHKNESYNIGYQEASFNNEKQFQENTIFMLKGIQNELNNILLKDTERNHHAIHLLHAMINKLFPLLSINHGWEDFKTNLLNSLNSIEQKEIMRVFVHPDVVQKIEPLIQQMPLSIEVHGKNDMPLFDFHVDWGHSGVQFLISKMHDEIEQLLKSYVDHTTPTQTINNNNVEGV